MFTTNEKTFHPIPPLTVATSAKPREYGTGHPGLAPLLKDYYESVKSHAFAGASARTQKVYESAFRRRVLPTLGNLPITSIKKSVVKKFWEEMATTPIWTAVRFPDGTTGYKPSPTLPSASTLKDALTALSKVMECAIEDEYLSRNPTYGIKPHTRGQAPQTATARALSLEELETLLESITEGPYRDFLTALAYTGCRFGEIAELRSGDVELTERRIHITRAITPNANGVLEVGTPKSGKARYVPILDALVPVLEARLDPARPDKLLFPSPTGKHMRSNNLSRAIRFHEWRGDVKKFPVGQRSLRFHDLRHTLLTLLAESGLPVHDIKSVAGHSTLRVTDIYTKAGAKAASRAAEVGSQYLAGANRPHTE